MQPLFAYLLTFGFDFLGLLFPLTFCLRICSSVLFACRFCFSAGGEASAFLEIKCIFIKYNYAFAFCSIIC